MSVYCQNCGVKIIEGASFCGTCGIKVTSIKTDNNVCFNCGCFVKKDDKYCPECGEILSNLNKQTEFKIKEINEPTENIYKQVVESTVNKPIYTKKNNKPGCFKKLFKTFLWIVGFLFVGLIVLYFIGDAEENPIVDKTRNKVGLEQTISDEEMKLPLMKVRNANLVITETIRYTISPSSKFQQINYGNKIKVSIPASFNSFEQSLAISKAAVNKAIMVEDRKPLFLVDLTLDNGKQPNKPVQLSYKFDANELNPNLTIEEQLDAFRWDEEGGGWVSLPIHIDYENNIVSAYVDHFSPIGFFSTVIDTVIKANDKINEKIDELDERIWNNMYITPEGNFRIYYSKSTIDNSLHFNNKTWKHNFTRSNYSYNKAYPNYIQDMGYFLETSLKRYVEAGFSNPASDKEMFNSTYKKPITVKLDSYYSKVSSFENPLSNNSQGLPSYEKIYERIHIPSFETSDYKRAQIVLAHELFHRMQAQYYGVLGMARPANNWFIEATAEYAAYEIAWPSQKDKMSNFTGSDYLKYSINSSGSKKGLGGKGWTDQGYEYKTSIWIKYLVASGVKLKDLIEYDAADYYKPLYSQQKFLWNTLKNNMGDIYRKFSIDMFFSKKSPLSKFDFSLDLATNFYNWDIEKIKEKSQEFTMGNKFSAQMGVVKVNIKNQQSKLVLITLEEKEVIGQTVDIVIINEATKKTTTIGTLFKKEDKKLISVNNGDLISLVLCNSDYGGGTTKVTVKDVSPQLIITPSELLDAVSNKAYSFEISAKDIIDVIEKVDIEWDFSDNTEKSTGFQNSIIPSSGEVKIKVAHTYEESDKEQTYPLKVILRESSTKKVLAMAEANILLKLPKPTVFITTRHLIGPPGATFDVTAKASPTDTYNFKWYIQGMSNSYTYQGEESTFTPVAKKLGKYNVNVKLYNLKNEFLSEDNVTIYVEEDEKTKELTDIDGGKVKKVIYRCDTNYYGCNVSPSGEVMFENSVKEMEKVINDFIKQGRTEDAEKASKNLAKMKADFQLEKDTTSCNCQRKRTPTIIYE
ncbi:zinc ribbon domain-containing protein [Lutibacter sp.]|uniref:zinc ribbon domain-containing protein n=1 Tax=Lutibacter sp. TaxID=1925666 RepID=UPI001A23EC74|nr:zinc ribbon domain-containing protein [Lutibacter sp.]MBI9040599.1 zinc ribbon domain-containing protein [Lutibacter sp.]